MGQLEGSDQARPEIGVSYLICAVPRSGSYLLCEGLKATGVAGNPTEYLSSGYRNYWSPRWGTPDLDSFMQRVLALGTTSNGVFGAKAHSRQFDYFARQATGRMPVPHRERPAILARWLPNLHYVRLRRRDPVRQAVSYTRAIQSNIWWDADSPPAPYDPPRPDAVRYDHLLIEASIEAMAEEDDRWERYFDATGITPMTLYYEDLADDREAAVGEVLGMLGVELPPDHTPTPPGFRKQADESTEAWVRRFLEIRAASPPPPAPLGAAVVEEAFDELPIPVAPEASPTEPPPVAPAALRAERSGSLGDRLGARRWWTCERPFRFARAWPVFDSTVYGDMVAAFREFQAKGALTRGIPGYDVTAVAITPENAGPFSVFLSEEWHDTLADLFGVEATGDINVTIHHHAVGSQSGSPHNDLNPGWFPESDGGITVSDARVCNYRTGQSDAGVATIERVRAVACIYHFANPDAPMIGGDTGLYRATTDPVERPLVRVPPVNNSLIAFECTPYSFHSFLTNTSIERTSLVMWLHRTRQDAVSRFGEGSLVGW